MALFECGGGTQITPEFIGGFNTYTGVGTATVTLSKRPKRAIVTMCGAVWRSGAIGLSTSNGTLTELGHYPANNVDGYSYAISYLLEDVNSDTLTFSVSGGGATPAISVVAID